MKDGHGGPVNKLAAQRVDEHVDAIGEESQMPRTRKSKDGNVREELGVPPYATSIPCAIWTEASEQDTNRSKETAVMKSVSSDRSQSQSKLAQAGKRQVRRAGSLPAFEPHRRFVTQEKALGQAVDRSRLFLNCPSNKWYKPLSNSDVAKFADAYTKAFGVGLYAKG